MAHNVSKDYYFGLYIELLSGFNTSSVLSIGTGKFDMEVLKYISIVKANTLYFPFFSSGRAAGRKEAEIEGW